MIRGKTLAAAAVCLAAIFGVTACGSDSSNGDSGDSSVKVAMVLPGPINDKGFNQSAYEGLQQCKKEGADTSYQESVPVPDYVKTFQNMARSNDLVIGQGFEFGDITKKVAPEFPDVNFMVTNNPLKPPEPNVQNMQPNSTQGAYLAGVAAGSVTKTNKLGGITGFKFPVLTAQMDAFLAGAKSVNPKATMKVVYLGTFDDVAKGKEAARSMAASGIDVIYHIADAAGVGVIAGASESGIRVVGWGSDQSALAPKAILTSQIVNQSKMIAEACQSLIDGDFAGGKRIVDGLRSGIVGLTKITNAPASVQEAVDKARQEVLDGQADVPSTGGGIPGSGPQSG